MIDYKNAIDFLIKNTSNSKKELRNLNECLNRISAEDVFAPIDVPSFDNSAMDGYAFRFEDIQHNLPIKVVSEIQAGTENLLALKDSEAIRIFTGAPIPENADTVVPQENVVIENAALKLISPISINANIRKKGTQTQKNTLILKKNSLITAEHLGFLATFGISVLPIFSKPKVGIVLTGKELVSLGNPLGKYQIYESNSVFLKAALQEIDIIPEFCIWVDDDKDILKNTILENLNSIDILICTGGISVGDYDFVKPVLEDLGVDEVFYKVKQKPGKPLFYGKIKSIDIFALPGNPSAVVTCFHAYVKKFLKAKMGFSNFFYDQKYRILINNYSKKQGLTHFVKAFVENNKVEILNNQMSYQMDAFAKANALVVLPENREDFQIGEKIEVIKFRN